MKKYDSRLIKKSIGLVFISFILFFSIAGLVSVFLGEGKVLRDLNSMSLTFFAGLLALSFCNYLFRSIRWKIFTKQAGISLSLTDACLNYISGFAFTTTPGKLGEGLRLWFIRKRYDVSFQRLLPLFVIDKFSDLHGMLILCLLSISVAVDYYWLMALLLLLTLALTFLMLRPKYLLKLLDFLAVRMSKTKVINKLKLVVADNAKYMSSMSYLIGLLLSILGWASECFAMYLLLHYFGVDITFTTSAFIFCFATLAGVLSFLPGGLLGAEASMFALLLAFGVTSDIAISATVIIRLTTLWFAVIVGWLVLPYVWYFKSMPENIAGIEHQE